MKKMLRNILTMVAIIAAITCFVSVSTAQAEQFFKNCPYEDYQVYAAGMVGEFTVIAYHYDNNGATGIYLTDDTGHILDLFTGREVFLYPDKIQVNLRWTNAYISVSSKGFSIDQYSAADY